MDLDSVTPAPTPLPALNAAVTYEREPVEITGSRDELLWTDYTGAGIFGAVVVGVVPTRYRGACCSCLGHWHVEAETVDGTRFVTCPSALEVVDPADVRVTSETHGTPVHDSTPGPDSDCYRCRDEHANAVWAACDPWSSSAMTAADLAAALENAPF